MLKFVFVLASLVVIFAAIRSRHVIKALFFSVLTGFSAVFAVNFIGGFIGVHIPVNLFSAAVTAIGGVSGAVLLLILQVIFQR